MLNKPAARENDKQFQEYVSASLPLLESQTMISDTLNHEITESEVDSTIKGLKTGKAFYTDNIGNDALRHGLSYFKDSLKIMLNKVFVSGKFPKISSVNENMGSNKYSTVDNRNITSASFNRPNV